MSRPLLIIRPEPGNGATCARAAALGLEALSCPLFQIRALEWDVPDPNGFDALLLTSANAVRHSGAGLSNLIPLPVWAVGSNTAEAARKAGFQIAREGSEGVDALLSNAPPVRVLHLAGRETTAESNYADITCKTVYASDAIVPGDGFAAILDRAPVVLLHSVRAARHFADHCPKRDAITLVTISAAVAKAAGSGWERVAIASQSSDEAMLKAALHWAQNI